MLEYQLVIRHQHHDRHIPCAQFWDGRQVFWGPGAERKANDAKRKVTRTLPAFHSADVVATFTA